MLAWPHAAGGGGGRGLQNWKRLTTLTVVMVSNLRLRRGERQAREREQWGLPDQSAFSSPLCVVRGVRVASAQPAQHVCALAAAASSRLRASGNGGRAAVAALPAFGIFALQSKKSLLQPPSPYDKPGCTALLPAPKKRRNMQHRQHLMQRHFLHLWPTSAPLNIELQESMPGARYNADGVQWTKHSSALGPPLA